jgi:hypothetical protein
MTVVVASWWGGDDGGGDRFDQDCEVRQAAVSLDSAEAAFGFEHPGGGPPEAHLAG